MPGKGYSYKSKKMSKNSMKKKRIVMGNKNKKAKKKMSA
jgi:hypothetical protein